MRRSDRGRVRPMFRGSDLLRMALLLGTLAIIGIFIFQLRRPEAFRGFEFDNSRTVQHKEAPPADEPGRKPLPPVVKRGAGKAADAQASPAQPPLLVAQGAAADGGKPGAAQADAGDKPAVEGTDLDPEQRDAAREEFQVVTDRSLKFDAVESGVYYRVLNWVLNQTEEQMHQRARKDIVYTQLMQWPQRYRGQLLELDLNVMRVLEVEPTDVYHDKLYEIWGYSNESRTRLYGVNVPELPEGFPLGPDVRARVRFVGYFFKLQGYESGMTRPGDRREAAPMLIGRLKWIVPEAPKVQTVDWVWGGMLGGLFLAVVVGTAAYMFLGGKRARTVPISAGPRPDALPLDEWMERAEAGNAPAGNNPEETRDYLDKDTKANGNGEGGK